MNQQKPPTESAHQPDGGPPEEVTPRVAPSEREGLGWDLLFDFQAMIDELEQTEGIVDVRATLHDPVPMFTLETIEHGLGIRVPEHIRSFYMVCDGLEFSWNYEQDSRVIPGGGAHLFDFATVFDSWLDSLWLVGDDGLSEEQRDFLWTLRGFDRTTHAGAPESVESGALIDPEQMIVICVEEEYPTYDLFLHDLKSHTTRLLDASFRDYFDCLLATRGVYGWQSLLLDKEDQQADALHNFFERIGRLFPHQDLTRWRS